MGKFYYNKYEKYVELKSGKCPICQTDWRQIIEDSKIGVETYIKDVSSLKEDPNFKTKDISTYNENDIKETFTFFSSIGTIVKLLCFLLAILLAIFAIAQIEESSEVVFIGVILAGIMCLMGIIFDKNAKWKAYMLQINYEIMKKK